MASGTRNRRRNEEIMEDVENEQQDVQNTQKRVRGPTKMKSVWALDGERISVPLNEHGQPVDKNEKEKSASTLAHFMGSIVRNGKYKIYKKWNKFPATDKQKLLNLVKAKFDLPASCEPWLLQSFAKKIRNYRSTLKNEFYNPDLSIEEQMHSKPENMRKRHWKKLLKYFNSEDAQNASARNKASRKSKKMYPATGKKSYARAADEQRKRLGRAPTRMERFLNFYTKKDGNPSNEESAEAIEKMNVEVEKLPEGVEDDVGPNDILSKVIGKDKHGQVNMFGLGVSPSDVWGPIPSRSASYRMAMDMKESLDKMSHTVDVQNNKIAELESMLIERGSHGVTHSSGSSGTVRSKRRSVSRSNSLPENQPLRNGCSVDLKSIMNPSVIVAKGWIRSLDPHTEVGREELGPDWCEVHIQVAVKRDEYLIRPYDLMKTIDDAVGATVAWPCHLAMVTAFEESW